MSELEDLTKLGARNGQLSFRHVSRHCYAHTISVGRISCLRQQRHRAEEETRTTRNCTSVRTERRAEDGGGGMEEDAWGKS